MESETYLTFGEYESLRLNKSLPYSITAWNELGLQWIFQTGEWQIVNKKKWFLAKIKYGI
jgi:hypothetical protein